MRWLALVALFNFKPDFRPIEQTLRNAIVHRALQRARKPKPARLFHVMRSGKRHSRNKRSILELAIGNAIRRRRHRDPIERIAALNALLDGIERWIERTVARLEKGLKLRRVVTAPGPRGAAWIEAPAPTPAFCDSS